MAELRELLREAVGQVGLGGWSVASVARRAHRRRRRQGVGAAIATVAVVVAVAAGVFPADDRAIDVVGQPDPLGGQSVFSSPTGVAILLDDGYDGIAALDLDTGVVGRRVIDGQRAGDQPNRLFRSGDSLIVGWGEVFAAPLDGGPSVLLGAATIVVPAAEPDRVWLGDWSGGSPGSGTLSMRLVDLHGRVLETLEGAGSNPTGVPGGVIFDGPGGAVLQYYDGTTINLGDARALAAMPHRYLTCTDRCDEITVLERGAGQGFSVPLPSGFSLEEVQPANIALSPDGAHLAFVTESPGPRLVVLDLGTGRLVAEEEVEGLAFPTWSPDSRQLFWVTYSYSQATTIVGRYQIASGAVESLRLSFGDTLRAVAVDRTDAKSFLPADGTLADPSSCPPPTLQPSYRTTQCGFRVKAEPPS